MDNYLAIIITSLATLIVTILGGLAVDRLKIRKAKIRYSVTESIPIELDDKKIGANIVHLENISSRTVKDVTLRIKAENCILKNSGISSTDGLDYEISDEPGELSISIPFLKKDDFLKLTTISEDKYYIPKVPDVSIRSPDTFETIQGDRKQTKDSVLATQGVIAAIIVGASLSIAGGESASLGGSDQSTNLALSAAYAGLPNIAKNYASTTEVYYYNQAPYIYALAKKSKDIDQIRRYRKFLIQTIEVSSAHISSSSKSALEFFIGKISMLLGEEETSSNWYEKAKKSDNKEYKFLSGMFTGEKPIKN